MILSFKPGTDDLMPMSELKGFAVDCSDEIFKPTIALIDEKRVILRSEEVAQPVKVRYAWADNLVGANLYNKENLPASPFQY